MKIKNLNIVILAAGQGKRMFSDLPKILHNVGNKPILQHVIEVALKLQPSKLIIVYGHKAERVKEKMDNTFVNNNFIWVLQDKQLGTGHALKCALPFLDNDGVTLVLYGDVPLITEESLTKMLDKYNENLVMLVAEVVNPEGYGRIIRNKHSEIIGIVEEKDATANEKSIKEINTGFYLLPNKYITKWLNSLTNNNSQNEYYITDIIGKAFNEGVNIDYVKSTKQSEILGINNKNQLEQIERLLQIKKADRLLEDGVTLLDKSRLDIRGNLSAGKNCIIDINCIFEGDVQLGDDVAIGASCILKNVIVHNGVEIKPFSIIEEAEIGINSKIGPFARIRPSTKLAENVHIGNFVEVKNSKIAANSKANHLTYIGDSEIGSQVNIGAGSVTCNYDGKDKFKTIIEDNVFVGSGTMMVAPVVLHKGGVIGAGSTITKDTPKDELTVARAKQLTIVGWLKRKRKI